MPEAEQTKICPLCAETIKAAAKVCPHCRHWQPHRWSFNHPAFLQNLAALFCVAAIFGAVLGLGYFLEHLVGPKRDFSPYRNQISVVTSEVSFRGAESNLTVMVVGSITNQTDFAWKNIGMEAQLFDKGGTLIDVIQAADSSYSGVVILPHSTAGFKIQSKAARDESEYATHKVIVATGKDFNTWP
jgi:hypothetical protein